MKRKFRLAITLGIAISFANTLNAQQKLNPAIEAKVSALLKQMTLEEKVGQMAQVSIESLGNSKGQQFSFSEKMRDAVVNYKIGSILNSPGPLQTAQDWNRLIAEIQNVAKETRLKIPILYGLDHIHGTGYIGGGTLFPQPIAQAATPARAARRMRAVWPSKRPWGESTPRISPRAANTESARGARTICGAPCMRASRPTVTGCFLRFPILPSPR